MFRCGRGDTLARARRVSPPPEPTTNLHQRYPAPVQPHRVIAPLPPVSGAEFICDLADREGPDAGSALAALVESCARSSWPSSGSTSRSGDRLPFSSRQSSRSRCGMSPLAYLCRRVRRLRIGFSLKAADRTPALEALSRFHARATEHLLCTLEFLRSWQRAKVLTPAAESSWRPAFVLKVVVAYCNGLTQQQIAAELDVLCRLAWLGVRFGVYHRTVAAHLVAIQFRCAREGWRRRTFLRRCGSTRVG